jgi:signal peptidase I
MSMTTGGSRGHGGREGPLQRNALRRRRALEHEARLAELSSLPVLLPPARVRRRSQRNFVPLVVGPHPRQDRATFEPNGSVHVNQGARNVVEWIALIALAVVGALLFKALCFQAFWIPSGSMEPTLNVGDRIVVDKLTYRFSDIHRGDIVVFHAPPDEPDPDIKDLIKRVVGLPGDTMEAKGGLLYRNGQVVGESYLPPGTRTIDVPKTVVGPGKLWVMGDNRDNSADSRVFGAIDENLVVGKAVVRWWPLTQIDILH